MKQPPEWPLPADGLRPMPSPYRSVVSSASPEFDAPPEPPPAVAEPAPQPEEPTDAGPASTTRPAPAAPVAPPVVAAGRATVGHVDLGPRAAEAPPTHPGTRDALVELVDGTAAVEEPEQPTTVVGTAAVPRSSLAITPRAASGSVPPAPGTYQPPGARPHPMEALPAGGLPPEPPLSPIPFAGFVGTPRRTLAANRGPALPRAISGPPARAVSGPPARIAAPTGSSLPFPGAGSDRPRTLASATIVSTGPPTPRRVRGMVALIAVLFAVFVLGIGGYFWALPVYDQTHSTVIAPNDLIGLPRLNDAGPYARFSGATTDLKHLGIDNPLMVGYMASDDPAHLVVVAGAPHAVWLSVGRDLDRLLTALAKNPDTAVESPALVDPGRLGGVARCGAVRGRNQLSVCGWQDHGTIGLLFLNNRSPAEAGVLMRAMRPALEHRTG